MRKSSIFAILIAVCTLAGCNTGVIDSTVPPEDPSQKEEKVKPAEWATVYGVVSCEGKGIKGAVVSDGCKVVLTDGNGVYNIASEKRLKYVFISIPSGYEVASDGVLPRMSVRLTKDAKETERVDFELFEQDQSSYSMLYFGDMHLAARSFCRDIQQFRDFTADVKDYMAANKGRCYAMTLGDMSWDYFWTANGYDLNSYLKEINGDLGGLQIFHTMGNHDNDSSFSGDFDGASTFHRIIGPSYYSFNIGGTHYIVLDAIEYFNSPAGERNFRSQVTREQIDWMVRDIACVDKKAPIVVTMHTPLYRRDGTGALSNMWDLIKNFDGFDRVQFVTAHTHVVYNVDMLHRSVHVYENNSGAVCGAWWMSGCNYPGLHIGTDGAPGGYRVMEFKGKEMTTFFKAAGRPAEHQFRVYDRNCICLDAQLWLPDASTADKAEFTRTAGEYAKPSTANEILINVWDYDPSWKISVTENGRELSVTQVKGARDPLYLLAYEAYEYDNGWDISYPSSTFDHMFKATASSPSSTVEVKVTDRYGRVFTERVARPRPFEPGTYLP